MTRPLRLAAVQAPPRSIDDGLDGFADEVAEDAGDAELLVYPELHTVGTEHLADDEDRRAALDRAARPLDEQVAHLAAIARDRGIWLVPGSVCERGPDGELFNTAVVISPAGELVARYRKVFPWRPFEPYTPGTEFVTFTTPHGRFGLSICYDAWFPEVTRHLAWQGAEVVLNVVKTTTPDRAQELVLARANAIVNQTFTVSVNTAGPVGMGRSLIVDPEGAVLVESTGDARQVLRRTLDLDAVSRVHEHGTAGTNRMWSQFRDGDAAIPLPLYAGRIDPATWYPDTEGGTR